jgi:hypothetical protein
MPGTPQVASKAPQVLVAGALPFSAIYVELYYIFLSVWGHKVQKKKKSNLPKKLMVKVFHKL